MRRPPCQVSGSGRARGLHGTDRDGVCGALSPRGRFLDLSAAPAPEGLPPQDCGPLDAARAEERGCDPQDGPTSPAPKPAPTGLPKALTAPWAGGPGNDHRRFRLMKTDTLIGVAWAHAEGSAGVNAAGAAPNAPPTGAPSSLGQARRPMRWSAEPGPFRGRNAPSGEASGGSAKGPGECGGLADRRVWS